MLKENRFRLVNEGENEDIWGTRGMLDMKLESGQDLIGLIVKFVHAGPVAIGDEDRQKSKVIEFMLADANGKEKEKEKGAVWNRRQDCRYR